MPVADYSLYCEMIDRAARGKFAYPAFNVTSMTVRQRRAARAGRIQKRRDRPGVDRGRAFASGSMVKDMALGAVAIAEYVHRVADRYPVYVAPAHRSLPGGQARHVRAAADRGDRTAPRRRPAQPLQQPHVRRQRPAAQGQPRHRRQAARTLPQERDHPRDRDRGGGRGGGRGQGRQASAKLYTTPEDTLEVARRFRAVQGRALPSGRHLRKRPRRLQAGPGEAQDPRS